MLFLWIKWSQTQEASTAWNFENSYVKRVQRSGFFKRHSRMSQRLFSLFMSEEGLTMDFLKSFSKYKVSVKFLTTKSCLEGEQMKQGLLIFNIIALRQQTQCLARLIINEESLLTPKKGDLHLIFSHFKQIPLVQQLQME
ncbi:hypothetical protein FGO68_gene10686 [Halteria grandinella]|uniref:Uncharacterized protein n=1 Tax=Halteria grandinella TaxID=5974 RepID=A0A8J8NYP0_HALGN|nr:hypothetical protein FGO68_gene10686 [Halteria grandinella]